MLPAVPCFCLAHLCIGKRLDVGARLAAADELEVVIAGGAQHLNDELELVDVVFAWEQRLPVQQLRQNAPHRPASEQQLTPLQRNDPICLSQQQPDFWDQSAIQLKDSF